MWSERRNLCEVILFWSEVKCSDVGWTDVIYVKWFYFEVKWSVVMWSERRDLCEVILFWSEV